MKGISGVHKIRQMKVGLGAWARPKYLCGLVFVKLSPFISSDLAHFDSADMSAQNFSAFHLIVAFYLQHQFKSEEIA